jgi:cobalt/nickel transport system permease protein
MIREEFAIGNSCIHRLNPQFRIVAATLFSTLIALSERLPTLITGLVIAILFVCCARLNPRKMFKKLTVIWGFLILLWLIMPLTMAGPALFKPGPLTFTQPGVMLALQITLKANSILILFSALIATMSLSVLGHSLEKLGISAKLVLLLLLTYRYIFVIEQEYRKLRRAAAIRSFHPGTNMHTYKTYAYLIGMLFVRASERAQRVHQAMRCRGFNGKFYCLQEFAVTRRDWMGSMFMSIGICILLFLEWGGLN